MQLSSRMISKLARQLHPNHLLFKCDCWVPGCMFCEGGLASCEICGGFEGTLTTHCCGVGLDENTRTSVYKGRVDFVDGKWVFNEPDGADE